MARDLAYEETWRDHLVRRVTALYDVPTAQLDRMVTARLSLGKQRYGDDDYMSKDMIQEALEEAGDCVVYALLESQKRLKLSRGGLHHLQQAAIHAALVFHHFREAAREH